MNRKIPPASPVTLRVLVFFISLQLLFFLSVDGFFGVPFPPPPGMPKPPSFFGGNDDPIGPLATTILRTLLAEVGEVRVNVKMDNLPKIDCVQIAATKVRSPGRVVLPPGNNGPSGRIKQCEGYSSRHMEFEVGNCTIDMGRLFMERSIVFARPVPFGRCAITCDDRDFGRFLTHPLTTISVSSNESFEFDDTVTIGTNGVIFRARSKTGQDRWGSFIIDDVAAVTPAVDSFTKGEDDVTMASTLQAYFQNLCIDLDGAMVGPIRNLVFSSNNVDEGQGRRLVTINCDLTVHRFPSLPPKF